MVTTLRFRTKQYVLHSSLSCQHAHPTCSFRFCHDLPSFKPCLTVLWAYRRRATAARSVAEMSELRRRRRVKVLGFVEEPSAGKGVQRAKSLTEGDLQDLEACVDLGFRFKYDKIPELSNTLPALDLCYSLDQQQQRSLSGTEDEPSTASPPITNWKICSPGDHPDEVKARLKYWAKAVACTVKLCDDGTVLDSNSGK